MSEEGLLLKFRLKTFSAFQMLAVGAVFLSGLLLFASMIFDGVRDWKAMLLVGFFAAVLLTFSFVMPWSIRFSKKIVVVRYLVGRVVRYDLHDLTEWHWWTNMAGNSGIILSLKPGKRLVIPAMFMDDRLPSILNRCLAKPAAEPGPTNENLQE